MKAKGTFLFLLAAVCLLCCACDFIKDEKEIMKNWAENNDGKWRDALEKLQADLTIIDGGMSRETYPEMYISARIDQIYCSQQDKRITIYFPDSYGYVEKKLCYSISDTGLLDFSPYINQDGIWKTKSQTDTSWRWEGGGIDGTGYVFIEHLFDRWYYVETFYPT